MTHRKPVFITTILFLMMAQSLFAVRIWPDRDRPSIELEKAVSIAEERLATIEQSPVYCVNATLLADDSGDPMMGFWRLGYATEKGRAFNVSLRMDGKINIQEVRGFEVRGAHRWPEGVVPPVSLKDALARAASDKLLKARAATHYCINATLVSGSRSVMKEGMWNLVYQTEVSDPVLVNIRMNGKDRIKDIERIRQLEEQEIAANDSK